MKKILWIRRICQVIFVILVLPGLFGIYTHKTIQPPNFVLLLLAFIAGNFLCGWFCPLGTLQEALGKIGSLFIKKKIKMPPSVQRYAQCTKYLLMPVLLIFGVTGVMHMAGIQSLPLNAYGTFFSFFNGIPLMIGAGVFLVFILLLSLFVDRPFCNYLCAHSVKFALASGTRIFTVKRNQESCVKCKLCDRKCPMNIQVSSASELRNLQCINCFECVAVCPVKNTLTYGRADVLLNKLKGLIRRS